jgi:hypothetical protein
MNRAGIYTVAASGAFIQVNKPRLFTYSNLEIAFFTGEFFDFGACN